jgi:hypothetical protein
VELLQAQEQSVRIVIREDIMSVVLGLIVIVRKMVIGCYKVESIFLHSAEPANIMGLYTSWKT